MKALIVVAHGSRRKQSNEEVVSLIEKIKATNIEGYDSFHASFLELATPSITDTIEACVNDGVTSIVLLPYFLNSGTHVVNDIPSIVNQAKLNYPTLDIHMTKHIGASDLMMDLILSLSENK
ncbi:sirohydrochlorin chelatase [Psychromonas sp. KJ10-10]|uniref:sirohydrochlorin chelatase n=1 Tax=Psychromonas sp. KJ10-10 TaxID=3391823 RepID=UPI0039B57B22